MTKVFTIVGARPQFVKAAALSRAFQKLNLKEVLVHTGQHFDKNMAEIFFSQMDIPVPKYNLGIHSLSHGAMTGRMIEELENVILQEHPSVVVVFGDTNSTLAGALAAKKLLIPIAHVEAGLRSYNMSMPEEVNRIVTDRISDFLFAPTSRAMQNLEMEGFKNFNVKIENTGDIMYDVALYYSKSSTGRSTIVQYLPEGKPIILATIHRQENTDNLERLGSLVGTFNELSKRYDIILPLHPRTRRILEEQHLKLSFDPLEPVGYFDMIELLKRCSFVITDSGGLQKEAYFFKKHCIVIRDETEWTELVDLGYNYVVGTDQEAILNQATAIMESESDFSEMPYGDGSAADKIAAILKNI